MKRGGETLVLALFKSPKLGELGDRPPSASHQLHQPYNFFLLSLKALNQGGSVFGVGNQEPDPF